MPSRTSSTSSSKTTKLINLRQSSPDPNDNVQPPMYENDEPCPGDPSQSIIAKNAASTFITLPPFIPHPRQLSITITIAIPNVFRVKQPPGLLTLVALDHVATACSLDFAPIVFSNAYKKHLNRNEIARFIIQVGCAFSISGADDLLAHSRIVLVSLAMMALKPMPLHYAELKGDFGSRPDCKERLLEVLG